MTITNAVTTPMAGTSGTGGTSEMQGLAGLFATLMGSIGVPTGTLQVTAATSPESTDAPTDGSDTGTAEGVMESLLKLGDGPEMTIKGNTNTVVALLEQVQAIYQKLVADGKLSLDDMAKPDALAGALTKLGMPADQAQQVAAKIGTMLEVLKQQQPLDDKTAGSVAMMLMAAMVQQQAQPQQAAAAGTEGSFSLEISAEPTQAPAGVLRWRNAFGGRANAGDVLREITGVGEPKTDEVKDASVTAKTDAKPETGHKGKTDLVVNVAKSDDGSVTVTLPPLTDKAAGDGIMHASAVAHGAAVAERVAAVSGTSTKVAADDVLEKAKGTTVYKLQADKNGTETLQAVTAVTEGHDAQTATANTHGSQAAQHAVMAEQASVAATDARTFTFAEKLAQAQHAQVGRQVAVQMQPLLDNGGGMVRMTLNPPELGKLSIELQVVDGKVHGTIAASDPAVVEQLARELHSFRQGLADAGLKLGDQGISLMLSNSNQQQGQPNPQGQQPGQGGSQGRSSADTMATSLDEIADTTIAAANWVAPDRVLDMRI